MRAIRLHPLPEAEHDCPYCRKRLEVLGWKIPGMRALAELRYRECKRKYYGDLTMGQALYTPMLLEQDSGLVHDRNGVDWFADWLRDSYVNRTNDAVPFVTEKRKEITREVVLLNCLDTLYGHCLLKLLNAQYYLNRNVDLILIVPKFLAWMVPDGVAEVWIVDLPLNRGTEWNEWIAGEVKTRIAAFEAASLSVAMSHPAPKEYDIERFTKIRPFPLEDWHKRLDRPVVTFIWRDDRTWGTSTESQPNNLMERFKRTTSRASSAVNVQTRLVVELAETLRSEWPALDFGVAGLSNFDQELPSWITDLRFQTVDRSKEQVWCERYATTHVVVGLHGSNMLLPTAHAGALVELIGPERYGNFMQDVLFRETQDFREMFFRYRFLSISAGAGEVAQLVSLQLRGYESFQHLLNAGLVMSDKL